MATASIFRFLAPVATAGIPLDDRMVSRGGILERIRGQLEWQISDDTFLQAFLDQQDIDNQLFSVTPFTVNELESLNKLRSRDLGSLARDDLLEFVITPEFESGRITASGVSLNRALNKVWGLST